MEDMEQETEPPLPAGSRTTVFIDNMSEDVWPFIAALDSDEARRAEIDENVALTDRQYLGVRAEFPKDLVFVAPTQIEPSFVHYVDDLVDGSEPQVVVPQHHSGQLSLDILEDNALFATLGELKQIQLASYCSSQPLYRLLQAYTDHGVQVSIPEAPLEQNWQQTVGLFGTKGGLRQALIDNPLDGVQMAPGVIVTGKEAIVAASLARIASDGGVVIKTNKGHAGMGVVIIRPEDLANSSLNQDQYIRQALAVSNGYWELFPAIVEAYIPTNLEIGGGFPNVECRVTAMGEVEVLFVCGMRVRRGVFAGVEMVKHVLPPSYEAMVREIGLRLGKRYADAGYRGYFDIDFIADSSGKLYVCESNVRRTGGTWAYRVAKRLFGDNFPAERYFVTNLMSFSNAHYYQFDSLVERLKSVLFSIHEPERAGAIVASANLLQQGKLNYMVVAKNKSEAAEIEREVSRLLE